MLRLQFEACLAGEVATTIKGIGMLIGSVTGSQSTLISVFLGSRRQVQSSHLEELKHGASL